MSRSIAIAQQHNALIATLQQQVSTGDRLQKPSDDPLGNVAFLGNSAQITRLDSQLTNISNARTNLNMGVSAMQESADILSKAREIALEGAQSGNDSSSYEALAQQVDALIDRLLDQSNTQNAGRYLFGGTATNTPPFRVAATNASGQPTSIVYQGGSDPVQEIVGQSRTMATLYPGDQVFQGRDRGATVITGTTGAAAGSGTDSATTQGTLTVRHTSTTFAAGSGVTAGSSSASGDTIIGPAGTHKLTINDTSGTGASGTVSLDGGPAIPFTSSDGNLKVSGPTGDVVYVNTTAITPGFSGDVALTGNGTLSVDGGATEVPIDFSANQVLTDSTTGAVTNVNSTAIARTGADHIDYGGTYDAFQILIALRDDLRNTRGLSENDQAQAISGRVTELERAHTSLLDAVGKQSVSLENLDSLESRIKDVQLNAQSLNADLNSVDLSQAVLGLQNEQTLLQLTFASAAKIFDTSLLDFLQ